MDRHELLDLDNVVAAGEGRKTVGGVDTGDPAIVAFVARGRKGRVDAGQRVPSRVEGMASDVVEIEPMAPLGRPRHQLMAGDLIGVGGLGDLSEGTAGMIYRLNGADYCLTNWHVAADPHGEVRGRIFDCRALRDAYFQIGAVEAEARPDRAGPDGFQADAVAIRLVPGGNPEHGQVGRNAPGGLWDRTMDTIHALQMQAGGTALVGWPHYHANYAGWTRARLSDLGYIPAPVGLGHVAVGDEVVKSGAITGHTRGKVAAVNAAVAMLYRGLPGTVMLRGQVIVLRSNNWGPVVKSGDSGSLVLDTDHNAVGLLYAGAPSNYVYTPIQTVLRALHGDAALAGYNLDREE